MKAEHVKALAEDLKGKKARIRPLDALPTDTRATKLPREVQDGLKEAFGVRLNDVRVHYGKEATEACKSLRAKAFTHGKDVFVARPADAKNKQFLAHELTHVIQQGGGRMPRAQNGKALVSK